MVSTQAPAKRDWSTDTTWQNGFPNII